MDGITTRNPIMDVPELIPMEDYDPFRARLQASIRWLLTKAFGNNFPTELHDPFYEDDQGALQFKMVLINGLVSGELYCRACAAIFPLDTHTRWDGHWSVMQALSRKGIYVIDTSDSAVTETLLLQTQPFKVNAHLAMIESLMQAFANEVITIDKVSQAVRKFSTFNASSELPCDVEDSIAFWMNKVCATVRHRAQRELAQDGSEEIDLPVIEDLLKDVNDGSCLATVISFYCPEILPLTEVAARSNLGIADSLYNVQLICDFCDKHLPGALTLSINDLFYTHPQLRLCLIAFLAELFNKFEVHKLPIVRDTSKPYSIFSGGRRKRARHHTSPTTSKRMIDRSVISNATKRSFQNSLVGGDLRTASSSSNPDLHNNCLPPPRRPLLPRRLGQKNNPNNGEDSNTPPRREERDGTRESMRAWEDQNNPPHPDAVIHNSRTDSARSGSTLLGNVSIDSDMSLDLTTDSSVDLSELEDTPRSHPPRGPSAPIGPVTSRMRGNAQGKPRPHTAGHQTLRTNPDELKVEHFTRATTARNPSPGRHSNPHGNSHGDSRNPANGKEQPLEPLLPAKLKPAKEKTANHTKEVESGEKPEKKSPSSPNKPRSLSIKTTSGGADEDSSSDEEFQTPSAENVPFFDKPITHPTSSTTNTAASEDSVDSRPPPGDAAGASDTSSSSAAAAPAPSSTRGRQYEAFFVDTDNPPISAVTSNGVPVVASEINSRTFDRHKPHGQSFTLHDNVHTPESAIAAGIPIVDESLPKPTPRRPTPRESANASKGFRGSPRDKMDQELSKLNADTRNKELKDTPRDSFFLNPSGSTDVQRPDTLNVPKPIQVDGPGSVSLNGDRPSPKTSFAEIKKQKDSGDVSPVTYLTHGSPLKNLGDKSGLKSAFHKVNPGGNAHGKQKKTSFAALPNQTTWQESIQKSSYPDGVDSNRSSEDGDSVQPMATELMSIRMRLEERRRQIESEKRRMEMQWNKQRQRVGKQAFIAVISKGKTGDGASPEDAAAGPSSRKTPEGPGGLKGVTDSGLGGSQTEGEPDTMKLSDHHAQALEEEARKKAEEEMREKLRLEREEKDKRDREEREKKRREQEERERRELEERERKEREELERKEQERKRQEDLERQREEERKKSEELEQLRELERLREKGREEEKERLKKEIESKEKERRREIEKEIEVELERERKRQRDIERELERELERERQKTRQAERDLELERLREKHSLLEKRLEEQLRERSESPGSGSDSSQSKSRQFSREGIQNLLDTGKQRWASREGTPESRGPGGLRPKSYAGGEVDTAEAVVTTGPLSTSAYAAPPPVSGMRSLAREKGDYGQGLDKLNTSLTDLQGEIMRLSLEQDHIKNMVTEPRGGTERPAQVSPKRAPSNERQAPGQSRYYGMYPEPSGEPDIAGGMRGTGSTASSSVYSQAAASVPGHPASMYGANQSNQYPPTHPMYQHPPYLPHTNQYGQYMPYQQQYPQPAPPPQYPQHPQGATTPLYHPPPGAPLYQPGYGPSPPGHQGQWPGHMQHPAGPYGPVVTSNPPTGQPYSSHSVEYSSGGPPTQTHTTSAHHSQQMSPSSTSHLLPGMTTSGGSGGHPDLGDGQYGGDTASNGSLPSSTHSHHSLPGGGDEGLLSPYKEDQVSSPNMGHSISPSQPAATSSPTSNQQSDGTTAASPSALSPGTAHIPDSEPKGESVGFVIAFDEPPKRQKPKLGANRPKKKPVAVVEPPITKSEAPAGLQATPPPSSPPRRIEKTPAVQFIIGGDDDEAETKSDVFLPRQQPDISDMERKKQRILEMQVKRKEEYEKKRLKMEDARAKKEEQNRLKQEELETKKADEKARREAIYAQYLQRKAEAENTDEDIKSAPVVKKRERLKPKAPRPKSQPPVPLSSGGGGGGGGHGVLADDRNSASSHSHSSQEDLYARGTYGGGADQVDVGYNLAYGGLTHRRPPSPVWRKPNRPGFLMRRVFPGNRMHAESLPASLDQSGQSPGQGDNSGEGGGCSTAEYHGPKLFVKPSSKSNRHIIMNAISHCCLAGTVNNGIKNKVTEIVQQSDGKHFIILFRDGGQQYRSVYTYNPESEEVLKLLGTGPRTLNNKMMERFYKYNSGSKSFSEVTSTKHLSVSIDAVTISNHYWQKKLPARKAGPNMY